MNIDAGTIMNYLTVEEDAFNEVASNTSIGKEANANGGLTLSSIAPSAKPNFETIQTSATTLEEDLKYVSPSTLRYTGDAVIPITSKLHIVKPQDDTPCGTWPVFRLLVR